jgi:hypothetical protein
MTKFRESANIKENFSNLIGAVKRAAEANFGAVKGQKRAVIFEESSREGPAGPGNPVNDIFCE